MLDESKINRLFQIFIEVDDFCKAYDSYLLEHGLLNGGKKRPGPRRSLSLSEIMTLAIFYHQSGFRCFQYYYETLVLGELKSFFPSAVSYSRFIELLPSVASRLLLFGQWCGCKAEKTGIYFADSKKLPVCENSRMKSNRVFKGVAGYGKSSTGWFYGLKLHLIINHLGEIVQFALTTANVSDNNKKVLDCLLHDLKGKCFADKGYLTKFFEHFYQKGIQLVTRIRKNMKNGLFQLADKFWLKKRAIIESVNDLLMTVFDIDHSRHRNPWNAVIHAIAGVCAYHFYPQKPAVFIPFLIQ
jgi:Transposase DDE domain